MGIRVATIAACLLCCPAAQAVPPAIDEYRPDLPGARIDVPRSVTATGEADLAPVSIREGVVGEQDPPTSPLSSVASVALSAPAALLAAIGGLLWMTLSTRSRSGQAR